MTLAARLLRLIVAECGIAEVEAELERVRAEGAVPVVHSGRLFCWRVGGAVNVEPGEPCPECGHRTHEPCE